MFLVDARPPGEAPSFRKASRGQDRETGEGELCHQGGQGAGWPRGLCPLGHFLGSQRLRVGRAAASPKDGFSATDPTLPSPPP